MFSYLVIPGATQIAIVKWECLKKSLFFDKEKLLKRSRSITVGSYEQYEKDRTMRENGIHPDFLPPVSNPDHALDYKKELKKRAENIQLFINAIDEMFKIKGVRTLYSVQPVHINQ